MRTSVSPYQKVMNAAMGGADGDGEGEDITITGAVSLADTTGNTGVADGAAVASAEASGPGGITAMVPGFSSLADEDEDGDGDGEAAGAGAGASDDFTFAAAHGITSDVPRLSDLSDEEDDDAADSGGSGGSGGDQGYDGRGLHSSTFQVQPEPFLPQHPLFNP